MSVEASIIITIISYIRYEYSVSKVGVVMVVVMIYLLTEYSYLIQLMILITILASPDNCQWSRYQRDLVANTALYSLL